MCRRYVDRSLHISHQVYNLRWRIFPPSCTCNSSCPTSSRSDQQHGVPITQQYQQQHHEQRQRTRPSNKEDKVSVTPQSTVLSLCLTCAYRYDFFDDVVNVLVGENEEKFVVHKKVICKTSKFFEAACRGTWREATSKTVRLPTIDPTSFGVHVGWL